MCVFIATPGGFLCICARFPVIKHLNWPDKWILGAHNDSSAAILKCFSPFSSRLPDTSGTLEHPAGLSAYRFARWSVFKNQTGHERAAAGWYGSGGARQNPPTPAMTWPAFSWAGWNGSMEEAGTCKYYIHSGSEHPVICQIVEH